MKIGDKIACHTVCVVDIDPLSMDPLSEYIATTIGKVYNTYANNYCQPYDSGVDFFILDDIGVEHYFSFNEYKKWFYTIEEYRKLKLNKIKLTST